MTAPTARCLTESQKKERCDRIESYKANLKVKLNDESFEKIAQKFTDLKCVVYRGYHYDPNYFSKRKRQAHRDLKSQAEPAVSYATQIMAGLSDTLVVNEDDPKLRSAESEYYKVFC